MFFQLLSWERGFWERRVRGVFRTVVTYPLPFEGEWPVFSHVGPSLPFQRDEEMQTPPFQRQVFSGKGALPL